MYPVDAMITNEQIMNMLIDKVQPYGLTINEKRNYIYRYHKLIHKNPNVKPAIYGV
jgi:proline dehydrogenase